MEADALKAEAAYLSARLALMRSELQQRQHTSAAAHWAEVAMDERRRCMLSNRQNAALRRALFTQRAFLLTLKDMLATPSSAVSTELNLHTLLHSYCHLGASMRLREQTMEAMFSEAKLDFAIRVVMSETALMQRTVLAPSIVSSHVTSSATTFGGTVKTVSAFDTTDVHGVALFTFKGAYESGGDWPRHSLMDMEVVGDSPKQHLRFKAATHRFRSVDSGAAVTVESRSVSCVRVTEQHSLLVVDSVDVDELYRPNLASGACVNQHVVAVYVEL